MCVQAKEGACDTLSEKGAATTTKGTQKRTAPEILNEQVLQVNLVKGSNGTLPSPNSQSQPYACGKMVWLTLSTNSHARRDTSKYQLVVDDKHGKQGRGHHADDHTREGEGRTVFGGELHASKHTHVCDHKRLR